MAHILIAEDDPSMLSFISKALENADHTVATAADGTEAFETLKNSGQSFDLLLTDIVMPGIDGVELAKKVKILHPEMKIMFITGFSASSLNTIKSDQKQTTMMTKPFHLNDLVDKVQQVLAAS